MASFDSSGWPSGATVTVYARDAFGNATGSSVTSATASAAGVASFSGLADSGKYVATDGSRTVKFGTPPPSSSESSDKRLTAGLLSLPGADPADHSVFAGAVAAVASAEPRPQQIPGCDLALVADYTHNGIYAADVFDRADTAAGLGTSTSTHAWTSDNGTIGVSSRQAYLASPGTSGLSILNSRVSDCAVEVAATLGPAGPNTIVTIVARFESHTEQVSVDFKGTGAGSTTPRIQLTRRDGGTFTGFGTLDNAFTFGATHIFRVEAKGNTYKVFVDGALVGTWTDAGTAIVGTSQGIGLGANDTVSHILAFTVAGVQPLDTETVSGWANLVGGGSYNHPAQATVAARPTYRANVAPNAALGAVRFDGVDDQLVSTLDASRLPVTVIAVISRTDASANHTIIGPDGDGGLELRANTNATMEVLKANVASVVTSVAGFATGTLPTAKASVVALTIDDTYNTSVFYLNGRPFPARPAAAVALTAGRKVKIGASVAAGFLKGDLFCLYRFTRVLTGEEIKQITAGLASRYGIRLADRLAPPTKTRLPAGTLKGVNIEPRGSDYAYGPLSSWYGMWGPNYSASYLHTCVDLAASVGANAIRVIGSVEVVATGNLTQAAYNARVLELVDYAAARGLKVYLCMASLDQIATATLPALQAYLASLAAALAGRPNIYAFDIFNELNDTPLLPEPLALDIAKASLSTVRAAVPAVALTVSNPARATAAPRDSNGATQAVYEALRQLDPYVDFYDFHQYDAGSYFPVSSYTHNAILALTDKPVVIGEYGATTATYSAAQRTAYYNAMAANLAAHPQIAGGFAWSIVSDTYGLFSSASVEQTDITGPFRALPGGALV